MGWVSSSYFEFIQSELISIVIGQLFRLRSQSLPLPLKLYPIKREKRKKTEVNKNITSNGTYQIYNLNLEHYSL